jgi:hypothetical protein
MMQYAHKDLVAINGQQFYKLMGSGKGIGFNPLPDWSVYSLVQIWDDERAADQFFNHSDLIKKYLDHTQEAWTLYMRNIKSHGAWSGNNPFEKSEELDKDIPLVSVITRATIRTSKLAQFWSYVPTSQKPIVKNKDLIYTKGIGEAPIVQMATFSLWKNEEALKSFAYKTKEHQKAIEKTRTIKWYKEELFARFQPYKSLGQWEDINQKALFKSNAMEY